MFCERASKRKFATPEAARKAATARIASGRPIRRLRWYACNFCGSWHLTSQFVTKSDSDPKFSVSRKRLLREREIPG